MAARIAFLIGNQTFRPDSGLMPLQGPANDVAALSRLLRDPERGNFEVYEFLDKPHHEVLPELEQTLGSRRTRRPFPHLLLRPWHSGAQRSPLPCHRRYPPGCNTRYLYPDPPFT
jgi:hypothetical protein